MFWQWRSASYFANMFTWVNMSQDVPPCVWERGLFTVCVWIIFRYSMVWRMNIICWSEIQPFLRDKNEPFRSRNSVVMTEWQGRSKEILYLGRWAASLFTRPGQSDSDTTDSCFTDINKRQVVSFAISVHQKRAPVHLYCDSGEGPDRIWRISRINATWLWQWAHLDICMHHPR